MKLLLLSFLICLSSIAQNQVKEIQIDSIIVGDLRTVSTNKDLPLVILTQGSGPTNRNGNQGILNSNHSKLLCTALNQKGYHSFSYDKRSIYYVKQQLATHQLLFQDFVNDLVTTITYFKDKGYSNIHLIGHSQGSLVSLMAAQQTPVNSVISIAGPSRSIDKVMTDQVTAQYPALEQAMLDSFEELKATDTIQKVNPFLMNLFAPQNQKFIKSWAIITPTEVVTSLDDLPLLFINGTNDLQVKEEAAKELHKTAQNSKLVIIEHMNHVFREVEGDRTENLAAYNQPKKPISKELVKAVANFISQE